MPVWEVWGIGCADPGDTADAEGKGSLPGPPQQVAGDAGDPAILICREHGQ
ncbi:hypothetical protein U746_0727 [Mycolicibacterium mucogenicum 261Sha1.1M5]|nr:hypothetical protein U746_0727 [Mycolicibacterium mucogenicum 261Sha1.1M5]